MKRKLILFVSVIFLMMLCVFNASAFENEFIKIDIPDAFSSMTESTIEGSAVTQWTDPESNSNVGVTIAKNSGVSYVDLSDIELSALEASVMAQLRDDVTEALKAYSVGYSIIDSECRSYEINGIKGVEILYNSEYSYTDGSTLKAKNYMYLFASSENAVTISATINSEDKLHFVDEMMNTFEFKEEVYVVAEDEKWFDSYELVKYTIVGAALGGAVGLFIAKKKKQKQNSDNNLPIA